MPRYVYPLAAPANEYGVAWNLNRSPRSKRLLKQKGRYRAVVIVLDRSYLDKALTGSLCKTPSRDLLGGVIQ